jgi:IS1 family transposase
MNKLSTEKRVAVVRALVEGSSIRATVRMTGVAKNTIVKLLADLGSACGEYMNQNIRNVAAKRVQCDEIWSFCYAKQKNVPQDKQGVFGYGDVWTWTAIDPETKLVISYFVGRRDLPCATLFMGDLKDRLANRVQLTTDGLKKYLVAVDETFGDDVDYAMLKKIYGKDMPGTQGRYSPAICLGAKKTSKKGQPDEEHISTSMVERQNLTMRMSMRRFTRLTNGFSKKIENLEYAVSLHFMYYNYVRVHQTLKTTPAVAAGLETKVWTIEDMLSLLEESEGSN